MKRAGTQSGSVFLHLESVVLWLSFSGLADVCTKHGTLSCVPILNEALRGMITRPAGPFLVPIEPVALPLCCAKHPVTQRTTPALLPHLLCSGLFYFFFSIFPNT